MTGTKQVAKTTQGRMENLRNKGLKFGLGGSLLNVGFIGVDSAMRMNEGESAPVAVGKAMLTNAALELIPGGLPVALGLAAVGSAPEVMNQLDRAAGGIGKTKQQFGGNFQETESQVSLMQQGLGNMQNARTHATRAMANHARGAQRIY